MLLKGTRHRVLYFRIFTSELFFHKVCFMYCNIFRVATRRIVYVNKFPTQGKCFLYCFYLRRAATPRTGYSRVSIAGSQSMQNEESCLIFVFFHLIFSVHLKRVNRVVVGTGGGGGGARGEKFKF
jgi:hypothetical protein